MTKFRFFAVGFLLSDKLLVFGTRPEAIKMAHLVKEIEKDKSIVSKVCVTVQHREILDIIGIYGTSKR